MEKRTFTEEQKKARAAAVRRYEEKNDRMNLTFPAGTRKRIKALGLNKTDSAFIRDTVLSKLDELEKLLK